MPRGLYRRTDRSRPRRQDHALPNAEVDWANHSSAPDLEIDHLLVLGGYVVANHVAPEVVVELMATTPAIRGLVGSAGCATAGNHQGIHSERARPF